MGNEIKNVNLIITGRVQGVWYRAWVVEQATKVGLAGWVRNRLDGSVEALFSGPQTVVDQMVSHCWQGPPLARVDSIESTLTSPPDQPGFQKRSTC